MIFILYGILLLGCGITVRNVSLLEQHTREIVEKTRKLDSMYTKLIQALIV